MTRQASVWLCGLPLFLAACAAAPAPSPPAGGGGYLVVAVGDSYASGQGAPDQPIDWWQLRFTPDWKNRRCNRSAFAGATQAVALLQADPAFAGQPFTSRSFACSGASIERGMLAPYRGSEPPFDPADVLPPQVEAVAQLSQQRAIDALIMTIGGNDILFEYIVAACVLGTGGCDLIDPVLQQRLAALGGRLGRLADALAQANVPPNRVFLLEYPDPTTATSGAWCDHQPTAELLGRVSSCEARWVSQCILPQLNSRLCAIAEQRGWHYVGGMAGGFQRHGWCAANQWINTIGDSLRAQAHWRGGVHPNPDGYAYIAGATAAAVKDELLGAWTPPTTCAAPQLPAFCAAPCGVSLGAIGTPNAGPP
ncbi:MAG: GDSL-type esterase/lipase family protein [Candidatus Binatia bacterium]